MSVRLCPVTADDAPSVSALVQGSFNEFVAPDWAPEAQAHFTSQASPANFAKLIPEATFAAAALSGSEMAGFILLSKPNLLDFLFVRKSSIRQGLGSLLWEAARSHIEVHHPSVKTVELNSSPYAVAAYRSLGFYPISEPFRRGGCLATRMACWLPGRALTNSNAA